MAKAATVATAKSPTRSERALAAFAQWAQVPAAQNDIPVDLKRVARLAQRQLQLEDKIVAEQGRLEDLQKQYFDVRCLELPEALTEANLKEFTLTTGEKVKLATEYSASLSGDKKAAAIAWLEREGYSSLVSLDLTVQLAKGHDALAQKIEKLLKKTFKRELAAGSLQLGLGRNVNTTSFKALVREQLEAGVQLPVEELGIFVQDAAKITRPKKEKTL